MYQSFAEQIGAFFFIGTGRAGVGMGDGTHHRAFNGFWIGRGCRTTGFTYNSDSTRPAVVGPLTMDRQRPLH